MDVIPGYPCDNGKSQRHDNDEHCSGNPLEGRQEEVAAILQYLQEKTDAMLVVHSLPSDGTTALLDHCVFHLLSRDSIHAKSCHHFTLADGSNVVRKLCGPSDMSQTVIDVISSDIVALLLDYHHHHRDDGMSEKERVRRTAAKELRRGQRFSRLTVLVVDGLDQLDDCGHATIDWIPDILAHNVKVIIGCWTGGAAMSYVRDKLRPGKLRHSLRVDALSASDCCLMLSQHIGHMTAPTASQWQRLNAAVDTAHSTLYARLVTEGVDQSGLYDLITHQVTSLPELFSHKCQCLERQLGHTTVSRCLAYITITSTPPHGYGLSDDELVDLLSRDHDAPKDGDRHGEALVAWTKMAAQLGVFINADEDGRRWRHSILTDMATKRYVKTSAAKYDIYSRLSDYYHAESGTKSPHHQIHRLVYLPVSLQRSNRLRSLRDNVLFNLNWIYAKFRTCGLHRLLADYDRVFPAETEVSLVSDALRRSEACIEENIESLALALSGRLLAYYGRFDNIRALIDACDCASASASASIVPLWPCYVQAGSPLQYTACIQPLDIDSQQDRDLLLLDRADGNLMLVEKCVDGYCERRLRVWDLTRPGPKQKIDIELLQLPSTVIPSHDARLVHVFTADNRKLQSYHVTTGSLYKELELTECVGGHKIGSIVTTDRYMAVALTSCIQNGMRYSKGVFRQAGGTQRQDHSRPPTAGRSPQTGGVLVIDVEQYVLAGRLSYCSSRTVAISEDNEYLACHVSPCSVAIHHLPDCRRVSSLSLTSDVVKLAFVPASTTTSTARLCALTSDNSILSLFFNLPRNQTAVTAVFHSVNDIDFRLSQTGSRMLISTERAVYVADGVSKDVATRQLPTPKVDGGVARLLNVEFLGASDVIVTGVVLGRCVVVWNTMTSTILRQIDVSESAFEVLTSRRHPALVTIQCDTAPSDTYQLTISLYNLTDVHQNWLPPPTLGGAAGHITNLALSPTGNRFVACGSCSRGLIIGSLSSGLVERVLAMPTVESMAEKICISERGRYAIVKWSLQDMPTEFVYNLDEGCVIYVTSSCCHTFFCPSESRVFFLLAANADIGTSYSLRDFSPTSTCSGHTLLPEVVGIVGDPAVVTGNDQTYVALITQTSSDKLAHKTHLYVCSGFESNRRKAVVLSATVLQSETLLLDVRHVTGSSTVDSPTVLVICKQAAGSMFAAFVELYSQTVMRIFPVCLAPIDNVTSALISRDGSIWVDRDFNVTLCDQTNGSKTTTLGCRSAHAQNDKSEPEADKPERGSSDTTLLYDTARLLLDGRVLVALESTRRQMIFCDVNTGQLMSRVPLEAHGTVLTVASDRQVGTVLVACDDGRVATFAVIGERHSGPNIVERMRSLPSRLSR